VSVPSGPYLGPAGRNDASRQIEKRTCDEKDRHTARRRDPAVGCRHGHRHKQQRPVRDERRSVLPALVNEYTHGAERGFSPESLDTSVAINQCRDGNPRPAIPVLERKLRGSGYTVPPRS
jgi:hypothetical protein